MGPKLSYIYNYGYSITISLKGRPLFTIIIYTRRVRASRSVLPSLLLYLILFLSYLEAEVGSYYEDLGEEGEGEEAGARDGVNIRGVYSLYTASFYRSYILFS